MLCLNVIFFFIFPIIVIAFVIKALIITKRKMPTCENDWLLTLSERTTTTITKDHVQIDDNFYINSDEEFEDAEFIKQQLVVNQSKDPFMLEFTRIDSDNKSQCKKFCSVQKDQNQFCTCVSANTFICKLLNQKMVYRNLKIPVGCIQVPQNFCYSIIGEFLETKFGTYKFTPIQPLCQIWKISDGFLEKLDPPVSLNYRNFEICYENADEVKIHGEITLDPKYPCLNIQYANS